MIAETSVTFRQACDAMRAYADLDRALARKKAQADEQRREIDEWYRGEERRIGFDLARLEAIIEPWAAAELAQEPDQPGRKPRKSATTPYGRAGYRKQIGRVEITDAVALTDYAIANGLYATLFHTTTTVALSKPEITRLVAPKDGAPLDLPGVEYTPAADKFYVRAVASGADDEEET